MSVVYGLIALFFLAKILVGQDTPADWICLPLWAILATLWVLIKTIKEKK